LFGLTDKIIQEDPRAALGLFSEIIDDGKDPGVLLVNFIEHFRNLMVAKVSGGDAKLVDLPQEICDRLFKQSQLMSLEEIFLAFNILIATQEMTKRLDSVRIPLEISLVRLAYSQTQKDQQNSSSAPVELKAPASFSEEKKPPKKSPEEIIKNIPQAIVSISLENVKEAWSSIVDNLSRIKMSVSTYLSEGEPTKVQGDLVTVAFPKSCSLHKESLDRKENKAMVEKAVSELCNADLRLNFILVADMQQNTEARSNPFVKSALDMFGGRVVKED